MLLISAPAALRSSIYCVCKARKPGSLISTGATTWACDKRAINSVPSSRAADSQLLLRIHHSGRLVGWIGDHADVGNQGLNLRLRKSIAVRRHQGRFIQRRATVADDRVEIGVADL